MKNLLSLLLFLSFSALEAQQQKPNILFLIADDWSFPHAGVYGDKIVRTPTFDRLAAEGALFTNAYTASPSCSPSRASVLTGRYPHQNGDGGNLWSEFPNTNPTYVQILEKDGYFSGSTRKGWGPGEYQVTGFSQNPAGWLNDSETIWNGLTKASRSETETYWAWSWIPCETIPGKQLLIDDVGRDRDESCGEWGFVERTRQVMLHYPSDGFIPSYSQDIASLPASNRYFIQGANHIEVLNMSKSRLNGQPNDATKDQFDDVFDLRSDIFQTAKR